MKKRALLLPLLLSANAYAGNYFSIQAVQSAVDDVCPQFQSIVDANETAIFNTGVDSVTTTCNDSDWGGRIAFGEQFNSAFGLEIGYQNNGEVSLDIEGDGASLGSMSLPMTAIDLALTVRTPLLLGIYLTGRVGVARWTIETQYDVPDYFTNLIEEKHSDTTAEYGIGAEWKWLTVGYNVISDVGFEDEEDTPCVRIVVASG